MATSGPGGHPSPAWFWQASAVLECVVNVSEGRDRALIAELAAAAGVDLLDVHSDPFHNRSVFTMVGEDAPRALAQAAWDRIDLTAHDGVHPRFGVVDVVPFVPLGSTTMADAVAARDRFGRWTATFGVPSFAYGPERSLPEVRRGAFRTLDPTFGPADAHVRGGAVALGARPVLVAWNLWLGTDDPAEARAVASALRGPRLRTLALTVGDRIQLSMNLVDPLVLGPAELFDLASAHTDVRGAELVGLVPDAVLRAVPSRRWAELDLAADRTIEARLEQRSERQAPASRAARRSSER